MARPPGKALATPLIVTYSHLDVITERQSMCWIHFFFYRFELDYNDTSVLNDLALPSRILEEGDRAPFIADLPTSTNAAVWVMETMYAIDRNYGKYKMNMIATPRP